LNPESDPRYRGNDTTEAPVILDPERIREALANHDAMAATFTTKGWGLLEAVLKDRRARAVASLISVASTMDHVNLARGALGVIDNILGLPEEHEDKARQAREMLAQIQDGEDA